LSASTDITLEGVSLKIAPPAAVSGAVLMGMTPAQWITTLTIIYLLMSIGLLIPKYMDRIKQFFNKDKNNRSDKESKEDDSD